jgi:hypothetical protein
MLGQVAAAQVPGTPVLQNAFANPGLAFAANLGGGGGSGHGYLGAAAAWGLGTGKLQISAGAGSQRARGANRGAYGVRAAANVWNSRNGALGAGAFVGFGGAPRTSANNLVTNPAIMNVPAGVSVGYRRALGATRGFAVYASPFYAWSRSDSSAVVSNSAFRFASGLDFAITPSIGVTFGGEFGARRNATGTSGNSLGLAVTFVPRRR